MAFASFDSQRSSAPVAEINMVPLIDVRLVLLVIFISTAPLLTPPVNLKLPPPSPPATQPKPNKSNFPIAPSGPLTWNGEPVSREDANTRLAVAGKQQPQPEIHLRADQAVPYKHVARTLADASRAGLTKVGFVSEPDKP